MRIASIACIVLIALAGAPAAAATMTEQEARLKAAEWIKERSIGPDPAKPGPAAGKSVFEIMTHIQDGVLILRGGTQFCGAIRKRTWMLIFDREASAWNGGNPLLINARTGQVLDCRSARR